MQLAESTTTKQETSIQLLPRIHACAAPPSTSSIYLQHASHKLIRPSDQLHLDGASSHRQLPLFRGQFQITVDVSPTSSCLGAYQARPGPARPRYQDAGPLSLRGSFSCSLPSSQLCCFGAHPAGFYYLCPPPCPAFVACLLACLLAAALPFLYSCVVSDGIALLARSRIPPILLV